METENTAPDPVAPNLPTVIMGAPTSTAPTAAPEAAEAAPADAEPLHCYHCGEEAPAGTEDGSNWLCAKCSRYQDSQVCPTCHSVVSASALPAEMVPEAHAPKKAKKGK